MAPKDRSPTTRAQASSPSRTGDGRKARRAEMVQILNVLTLTHHRNRNQHRRSRWWKEFNLLRRNVRRVVLLMVDEEDGESGSAGVGLKEEMKAEMEARFAFLRERILMRCWVAFTGLVGDNQYAALGLMLLGTLGSLGKVLGWEGGMLEENNHVEDLGERESREVDAAELLGGGVSEHEHDLGVPLAREELVEPDELQTAEKEREHIRSGAGAVVTITEKPAAKKKRKKHHDAIDELFSGLI